MNFIEQSFYKKIIKSVPILCVDLIIIYNNKFLLIKRKQEPLKDEWWVPGGRVFLGEKIEEAAKRKLKQEVGIDVNNEFKFYALYQDFFNNSSIDSHLYHTLSIVFKINIDNVDNINIDSTSSSWALKESLPERFKSKLEIKYD